MTHKSYKSALKVQEGIEQPQPINIDAVKKIRGRKTAGLSIEELTEGVISGNITILSRAITLIESTLPDHQKVAQQVLENCLPYTGRSLRIGITGVPGVGKSSFIEVLGKHLTRCKHKLAVLAIDPSSYRTKGSILGDKTRMEELAADANAYIRPSPSAGTLGGVARKTWETIMLCEAAGFNVIFVETVGVGQSETLVHSMVDFFLLLMLPGAGDELQGIKRGIMEIADAIVINKSDGDNVNRARAAMLEYKNALHLFPLSESGWEPSVKSCSAKEKTGIAEVWKMIEDYFNFTHLNGYFEKKRIEQVLMRMRHALNEQLLSDFYCHPEIKKQIKSLEQEITANRQSSYMAATKLLRLYYSLMKKT